MNPEVSVVMGVYNGGEELASTIESVLSQTSVDFEFIIVNDGSTDETREVLDRYQQNDARVRVIHQRNQGLTVALRQGCDEARAPLIARQDCGDISLDLRLARQRDALQSNQDIVMLGTGVRTVFDRTLLFERSMSSAELAKGLSGTNAKDVFGPPHHGSIMMRTEVYLSVGGYRREFYFAQDLDLWLRMSELGKVSMLEEVLYEASFSPGAISGVYRAEQDRLKSIALDCRLARMSNRSETDHLLQASSIRPKSGGKPINDAEGHYFIGACLNLHSPAKAVPHFRAALRQNPWHWRAALQLLKAKILKQVTE